MLLKIKKIDYQKYSDCYNLIAINNNDKIYFEKLGWTLNQFKNQLSKENNFSLALFKENLMISFILGDIISVDKIIEYEILLIYVSYKYRQTGCASKLLNEIPLALSKNYLKKIYLEVSSDNYSAIKLYKKNNFIKTFVRKNYYQFAGNNFDALLLEKKIYEQN